MSKETFMLVSLKEQKAKKLAQVITNPTCRKILDYLANKESTESEISKELSIPISTVHYNLSQLKESNLVEAEEFHYSKKGKEIAHYKLANKYIIIAPKESFDLMDKLKNLIPVSLILAAGIGIWQYVQNQSAAPTLLAGGAPVAMLMQKSAEAAFAAPAPIAPVVSQPVWPMFVYGAVAALILYLLIDFARKKFRKSA